MPSFSYCIAFPRKIKEIFSAPGDFFAKIFHPAERKGQQIHQIGQRIGPKGPQGPQRRGEGAEKQHGPADGAQHHKAPQLSLGPAEEKEKHGAPHRQAVQGVQRPCQPGEPQAKGAQQVIQQPGGQAQQDGLGKYQQLLGDLIPHTIRTDG